MYEDILKLVNKRFDVTSSIKNFHRITRAQSEKGVISLKKELINNVQESSESGGENRGYRSIRAVLLRKVNGTLSIQLDWTSNLSTQALLLKDRNIH